MKTRVLQLVTQTFTVDLGQRCAWFVTGHLCSCRQVEQPWHWAGECSHPDSSRNCLWSLSVVPRTASLRKYTTSQKGKPAGLGVDPKKQKGRLQSRLYSNLQELFLCTLRSSSLTHCHHLCPDYICWSLQALLQNTNMSLGFLVHTLCRDRNP